MIQADCRSLPYKDRSFDMIFTSPPWDRLDLLPQAREEVGRVLTRHGLMVMILPHLDSRELASLVVANRDWSQRQSFACEAPRRRVGPRYFAPSEDFVRRVLNKYRPSRLLDPFCGTGTIVDVARRAGVFAQGSDIEVWT